MVENTRVDGWSCSQTFPDGNHLGPRFDSIGQLYTLKTRAGTKAMVFLPGWPHDHTVGGFRGPPLQALLRPETHAGCNRLIRSRIAASNLRGNATSARWKRTYLACVTTFAPI